MIRLAARDRGSRTAISVTVRAGLVLAVCSIALSSAATAGSSSAPLTTRSLPTSSECANGVAFFQQAANGDFSGCFRVPELRSSSLVVALQTYLENSATSNNPTTTLPSSPSPVGPIRLSSNVPLATPGQSVEMTGRLSRAASSQQRRQTYVNVCWDGCPTGLQESAVPLTWTSATTFRVSYTVPEAPWLSLATGVVSVHPLVSGRYEVGLQCFGQASGCALGAADASTNIGVTVPTSMRCGPGRPCETMTLSTAHASVGDMVFVSGWAPLQSLIGASTAFSGYTLTVTPGSPTRTYPDLAYARESRTGSYDVVLTPRVLHIRPSPTWASLGRLGYLSSTFAGPSNVSPVANSNLVAWCPSSGVDVSDGPTTRVISTAGVASALRGSNLSLAPPVASQPPCADVLLDPRHHESLFASFTTEEQQGAPPFLWAGLYTANDGATWHRVPTPRGMSAQDFGGFVVGGHTVVALFDDPNNGGGATPQSTVNGRVVTAATSDGGVNWSFDSLGCPSVGPCVVLGAYQWGHCAMHSAPQELLRGPGGAHPATGVVWTVSTWAQSVDSCYSPQLAITSSRGLLLADPSSQFPLMRSTDGGVNWSPVSIPQVTSPGFVSGYYQMGDSLLLAPNGDLISVETDSTGQHQGMFLLVPGATAWCQVSHAFSRFPPSSTAGPLRIGGGNLYWEQTSFADTQRSTSVLVVQALSTLHC